MNRFPFKRVSLALSIVALMAGCSSGVKLDDVPVDGLLDGEAGAVGLPHDAWVMPSAALVEPFQQLGAHFAGGATQS